MPSNVSILTQIKQSSGTSVIPIYSPSDLETSGYITTLKATVNIKSIGQANFPYIPDNTPPETLEAILTQLGESLAYFEAKLVVKKGNGAWIDNKTMRLFNKDPYYEMDLLAYLTDSNTFDCGPDFTIGFQMLSALSGGDFITILGCAVEEKKTDDLELLTSRVNALETLLSTFVGATASADGAVGLVPKPVAGDNTRFLRGDRTWQTVSAGGDYQPLDPDLTAIAALAGTGLIERTGNGTAATTTITGFAKTFLDDSTAAAVRTTLGLPALTPRAWVIFNGISISIANAYNVTSITDNGVGDYTINFTAGAIPNANYLAFAWGRGSAATLFWTMENHDNVVRTTSALRIYTLKNLTQLEDMPIIEVVIFCAD